LILESSLNSGRKTDPRRFTLHFSREKAPKYLDEVLSSMIDSKVVRLISTD
jgi:hypothetical protein